MSILTPHNPTLGYRARNATESAHPELWRGLVFAPGMFEGSGEVNDMSVYHAIGIWKSGDNWSTSRLGYALDLDRGVNNIAFSHQNRFSRNTAGSKSSVGVWVFPRANANMYLLNKENEWAWRLRQGASGPFMRLDLFGDNSGTSSVELPLNEWSFTSASWEAGVGGALYLNGEQIKTFASSDTSAIDDTTNLLLGSRPFSVDTLDGLITKPVLYDRELKSREWKTLSNDIDAIFRLADDTAILAALSDTGGTAVDAAMALASRRARVSSSAGVDVQSNGVIDAAPSAAELDGLIDVAGDMQSVAQRSELKAGAIVDIEGVVESTSDEALASIGADVQVTGTVDAVSDEGEVDSFVDVSVSGGASITAAEARIVGDVIEITVDPNQPATPSQRVIIRARSRTFRPGRESRTFRPRSGGNTYKPEP